MKFLYQLVRNNRTLVNISFSFTYYVFSCSLDFHGYISLSFKATGDRVQAPRDAGVSPGPVPLTFIYIYLPSLHSTKGRPFGPFCRPDTNIVKEACGWSEFIMATIWWCSSCDDFFMLNLSRWSQRTFVGPDRKFKKLTELSHCNAWSNLQCLGSCYTYIEIKILYYITCIF